MAAQLKVYVQCREGPVTWRPQHCGGARSTGTYCRAGCTQLHRSPRVRSGILVTQRSTRVTPVFFSRFPSMVTKFRKHLVGLSTHHGQPSPGLELRQGPHSSRTCPLSTAYSTAEDRYSEREHLLRSWEGQPSSAPLTRTRCSL